MCVRFHLRAHFVKDNWHTSIGCLPGGFRACKAAANDMNGIDRTHKGSGSRLIVKTQVRNSCNFIEVVGAFVVKQEGLNCVGLEHNPF